MRLDDQDRLGILAATVTLALIFYLATCATARAEPYTLRFRNPDTVRAYTQIRTAWGTVAAPCAPGATCSVVVDLPAGPRHIAAEATDGAAWSAASNALDTIVTLVPVECLSTPACRFDFDGDGWVSGTDFAEFVAAFGSTWFVP